MLQRVLLERLAFRPLEPGLHATVEFRGRASIGGLLTGTVGVQNKWRVRQDSAQIGRIRIEGLARAA